MDAARLGVWSAGRWAWGVLLFGGVAVLALVLWLVVRRVRTSRRRVDRSLRRLTRELLTISNEIIALDHVFVTKGNLPGALTRLREMRRQLGLSQDRDLAQIETRLEPHYTNFIWRLINHPRAVNFLAWVQDTVEALPLGQSRGSAGKAGLNITTLTREQFDSRCRNEGFAGHWLVKIQNWDVPEVFEQLRLYLDRRSQRYFEHWLADNLRHARSWSVLVLEYTMNTMWNRKLTIRFFNDGPGRIDLTCTETHLGAQFQEFLRDHAGFVDFSRSPADLLPSEKYWIRISDLLSILQDIHARQTKQ